MNNINRKKIAFLFGGRSAEHEISVITALQAMSALDITRFAALPVYIDLEGRWFYGEALRNRSFYHDLPASYAQVEEVLLLPLPGQRGLKVVERHGSAMKLSREIAVDVFLPAFHGQFGEDGCVQGLLELAGVPYSGCGVPASAVAMNKYLCKAVAQAQGVPVLPCAVVVKEDASADIVSVCTQIMQTPGLEQFPLFVKPCNLGSSIGVGVAHDQTELAIALARVFKLDFLAMVEPCVTNLMEINVSVLDGQPARASVVEIPVASAGTLTYEDKYLRGGGKKTGASQGMASLTRLIDPQDLDPRYKEHVSSHALNLFKALGCSGVARFDFMVDTSTGKLYFNELNPLPGSMSFYLWVKSKPQVLYTEILNQVIELAERRAATKASLQFDMGFKALKKA